VDVCGFSSWQRLSDLPHRACRSRQGSRAVAIKVLDSASSEDYMHGDSRRTNHSAWHLSPSTLFPALSSCPSRCLTPRGTPGTPALDFVTSNPAPGFLSSRFLPFLFSLKSPSAATRGRGYHSYILLRAIYLREAPARRAKPGALSTQSTLDHFRRARG